MAFLDMSWPQWPESPIAFGQLILKILVQIPPGWWRVMENMASYSALGEYGLWKFEIQIFPWPILSKCRIWTPYFPWPVTSQGVFAINTPTIHVSVQLHPFHEVEIKQHRVIMTEYVFHTLEANFAEFAAEYGLIFGSWSLLPNMDWYSAVMDFTAEYGLKTSQVASWIWKRRGVL